MGYRIERILGRTKMAARRACMLWCIYGLYKVVRWSWPFVQMFNVLLVKLLDMGMGEYGPTAWQVKEDGSGAVPLAWVMVVMGGLLVGFGVYVLHQVAKWFFGE